MPRFSWLRSAFLLILAMSFLAAVANAGSVVLQDCPKSCAYRCSETHHQKPCLLYCNKCCRKCLCVPSGTYGHKEECPCYNNWKTKEGKPKCP